MREKREDVQESVPFSFLVYRLAGRRRVFFYLWHCASWTVMPIIEKRLSHMGAVIRQALSLEYSRSDIIWVVQELYRIGVGTQEYFDASDTENLE